MKVYEDLGKHNICDNIDDALKKAKDTINEKK